ncbi:MAG: membrane protein insertase YidC [Opitutales bacterium]|jgi:YidC/Oxa1 family membrane protein insertase|nr:membrane protein insertase YidC [Opitutales bacterium]
MDRKNLFLGVGCIAAAMFIFAVSKPNDPAPASTPAKQVVPTVAAAVSAPSNVSASAISVADAQKTVINNGYLKVTFTSRGGAIEKAELLKQSADLSKKENIIFNAGNEDSAMTLGVVNRATNRVEPVYSEFKLVSSSATSVVYQGKLEDGTKVTRTYTLPVAENSGVEPYSIRFQTKVEASGAVPTRVWHSTGTWHHTQGDVAYQFMSVLADNGEDLTHVGTDVFRDSSGFLGLGAHRAVLEQPALAAGKPFNWVSSGNQFFASIIRVEPNFRGNRSELVARPVKFDGQEVGIQAFAYWEGVPAADLSVTTEGDFFVGPKEYARLAALPDDQASVLQFSKILGFISFGAICKLLLACLGGIHSMLAWTGGWSWGWAIVILTVIIKLVTWPLTAAQQRTAQKMTQFKGPMEEIREKYKNDSEKLNKEMMKLYTEHKINPFAGCLPILIQIPVFFGLYTAFQTTVELRLEPFLWIHDLSTPDTLFYIGSFGFNLLPILMGLTMWLSMRMTPTPSVDNTQKTIMYTMALLFPVICYSLPAALSLYMTLQNLLVMLQMGMSKTPEAIVEVVPLKKKKAKN